MQTLADQMVAATVTAEAPALPFILVTGGKGGVGKSTLALNLTRALGALGRRTLLADLDLSLANLDVLLGLESTRTMADILDGTAQPAECLVEGPGGITLLPASSGNARLARLTAEEIASLPAHIFEAARGRDLVVGDTAAGIGPEILNLGARATRVLVVTTPDHTALTDAYGVIKALDHHGRGEDLEIPTPDVFINMASGLSEAKQAHAALRKVTRRFLARSPRLAGWMPRSTAVQRCALDRTTLIQGDPKGAPTRALNRLAADYSARLVGAQPTLKGSHGQVE